MHFAQRFAVMAMTMLSLAPAQAAELAHNCLDQKERRAEVESGRVVRLDTALRAIRSKMPGTLVRARLKRKLATMRGALDERKIASLYRGLLHAGFSGDVIRTELRAATKAAVDELPEVPAEDG